MGFLFTFSFAIMTRIFRHHALFAALILASIVGTLSVSPSGAIAQETPTLKSEPSEKIQQTSAPQDFFSFGLSFHQTGGSRFFSLRLTPMFSAMYTHKFMPWLDIEGAVHFTGRSGNVFANFISATQTGDVSAMFTPFAGNTNGLERFRVGGGISLQNTTFAGTGLEMNAQGAYEVRDMYSSSLTWGGHLKVDYLVPLSSNVDLGLRAQAHIVEIPSTKAFGSYTPSLSLGGFIRFGW